MRPGRARRGQRGISLVEVAIVLVIIGLLIGSILKGQEMINSARVRDLADMSSELQTAYFGFFDRYHQVPGDWPAARAGGTIGAMIVSGGNGDGAIDHAAGAWVEPNAMWEHLTAAGFVKGAFDGGPEEPDTTNGNSQLNAFNGVMTAGRSPDFFDAVAPKLHVLMGRRVPVRVYSELDTKVDDGDPATGEVRASTEVATVFAGDNSWGGSAAGCVEPADATTPARWNTGGGAEDCNAIQLF